MKDAMQKVVMHSCGGWYIAEVNDAGWHHEPHGCVRGIACHDTPEEALRDHEERLANSELDEQDWERDRQWEEERRSWGR